MKTDGKGKGGTRIERKNEDRNTISLHICCIPGYMFIVSVIINYVASELSLWPSCLLFIDHCVKTVLKDSRPSEFF